MKCDASEEQTVGTGVSTVQEGVYLYLGYFERCICATIVILQYGLPFTDRGHLSLRFLLIFNLFLNLRIPIRLSLQNAQQFHRTLISNTIKKNRIKGY